MEILVGRACKIRLIFGKEKIHALFYLDPKLIKFKEKIDSELLDVYDRNYSRMFNVQVNWIEDRLELVFSGYPVTYMFEKFIHLYLPRFIGFLLSNRDTSKELLGAYLYDSVVVITDKSLAYVKFISETEKEELILKHVLRESLDKIIELELTYFSKILPRNKSVFCFITMPDKDGCFEYYDYFLDSWQKDCLTLPLLSVFQNADIVIYSLDFHHKKIKELSLGTFKRYVKELISGLNKIENKTIKDLTEELAKSVNYGVHLRFYKILSLLSDIRDALREYKIEIGQRYKYLLKRLLDMGWEVVNNNQWLWITGRLIARKIAERVREETLEKETDFFL